MDPGQSMDCPAQTVDPRFAQTIHGLSHAQHEQLNTYPKPQKLQCRIPNPSYESLTLPCVADRSLSLRLRPVLCVAQSVDPRFVQGNPRIVPIYGLCMTYRARTSKPMNDTSYVYVS